MTKRRQQKFSPGDPDCEHCLGTGFIPITEDDPDWALLEERYGEYASIYATEKRCVCLLDRQFRKWVGEPIYNAEPIEETFLGEHVDDNLFINATKSDFLSHFRTLLSAKSFTYFWRRTHDSHLRDIFVGNVEDYPSLSSFVRGPELLVVQLGSLSYKNVAMSGIVLEVCRVREFESKPTWIVNAPDQPFKEGHLAYSPELDWYISENFDQIRIKISKATEKKLSAQEKKKIKTTGNIGLN